MFKLLKYAKYGDGKYIDIAKGGNKQAETFKEIITQIKREIKAKRNDKKGN